MTMTPGAQRVLEGARALQAAANELTQPKVYPVDHLVQAADKAREARAELADAVVIGRDVHGFTWRVIAQAVGMTEHGVAALYRREKSD